MPESDYKIYLFVQMLTVSGWAIWTKDMTDYTLLPNRSSFAVHNLCDATGKEALANDYYYWQAVMGGKQKIKHASLPVVRLWGVLAAALVVVHYDTLCEMKRSIVPDDHSPFPSQPDIPHLLGQAIFGLISCRLTRTLTDMTQGAILYVGTCNYVELEGFCVCVHVCERACVFVSIQIQQTDFKHYLFLLFSSAGMRP